tara:strand:+ start:204 stop:500 length:297 start_codon:yes stop_codon:yes gene_type:complete
MEWIKVKDRLPNDSEFVLCTGIIGNDDEFINEVLDTYAMNRITKQELPFILNPVTSCQFKILDNTPCWLVPDIMSGGLVDFGDSITHWMHLPKPPQHS